MTRASRIGTTDSLVEVAVPFASRLAGPFNFSIPSQRETNPAMPNYREITAQGDLEALFLQITQAKSNGQYVGQEAQWDQQVVAILDRECGLAHQYVGTNASFTEGKFAHATNQWKTVKAIAAKKKSQLEENDAKAVAGAITVLTKYHDDMDEDSRALAAALTKGYRGGWPAVAKKCLHNQNLVTPYMNDRNAEIDDGKEVVAKTRKVAEYIERSKELVKQIKQSLAQGAVDVQEFLADIEGFVVKMQEYKDKIDDKIYKVNSKFDFIEEDRKRKSMTEAEFKGNQSRLKDIQATSKELRATFKTMQTQGLGLKKRVGAAGPGYKDLAKQQLTAGLRILKDTEAIMKDFLARETKATKDVTGMEKKVK